MPVNKNNILRWNGVMMPRDWDISSSSGSVTMYATDAYILYNPIPLIVSSTLGINTYTFKIIDITDFSGGIIGSTVTLEEMCEWDGVSSLKIFRPIGLSITAFRIVFTIEDYAGNLSDPIVIIVNVSAISTDWIEYPPSFTCTLDAYGNNTGYKLATQLVKNNPAIPAYISPLELKDNVPSDMDYIAPTTDYISCPTPSLPYAPLTIGNYTKNPANPSVYIVITNVYISASALGVGGGPIALNIPCEIIDGTSKRFLIPSGNWDIGLTITYTVYGDITAVVPPRYWMKNNSGLITGVTGLSPTTDQVINAGVFGSNPINLPTAGSTIFAK